MSLEQKISEDIRSVIDSVENVAAEAVGFAELAGLRYPVKHYSAWVDEPRLMRGSRVDTMPGYQFLYSKGIRLLVDLRAEGPGDLERGALRVGLCVLPIPLIDNTVPTEEQVAKFLKQIVEYKLTTYVHCEAGLGRTGIMCAAYRVRVQGWSTAQALAEAQKYGLALPCQEEFIRNLK